MFILLIVLLTVLVPCDSFCIVEKHNRGPSCGCGSKCLVNRQFLGPMHQRFKLMEQIYSGDDEISQETSKQGYKFGDITWSLGQLWSYKVNELTGKETYEFGDLTRWMDGRAKERVQAVKLRAVNYTYEFGDLMLLADNFVKEKAANFAGKENAAEYQFGDVTKAVIQKVLSGEYDPKDVYLALRILAVAGFALLPAAEMLPVKALIEIFECGLINDVAGRLLPVLAVALDRRMKEALTGDANYQLGDKAKERLRQQLASFTGKVSYEFGDIAKSVAEKVSRIKSGKNKINGEGTLCLNDKALTSDLEAWDQQFLRNMRENSVNQRV
jgi:hypothetical protein